MFEAGLLAGKRILITGGGSGLGAAMAQRFAGLGASLVLCGRRAQGPSSLPLFTKIYPSEAVGVAAGLGGTRACWMSEAIQA